VRGERLRVESSSRGWRRLYAGFITLLVALAVVALAVEDVSWLTRAVPVALLIGHVPLAVGRFAYTKVSTEGLDLDIRVRRRRIPWDHIETIELGGPYGRPPRVVLTDGSEVTSLALGGFLAGPEEDSKLQDHLTQAADRHGFGLKAN
jgi:hypothetical protein